MAMSPGIFREYDIRGVVDRDLTEAAAFLVGRALGTAVREQGGHRVVVGRDCRESGPRFAERMAAGLTACGVDVVDLGVVPTPLVYFAAATLEVDGLCQITGSHNPPEYNGLKVGVGKTTLHGEAIQELLRLIQGGRFADGQGRVDGRDVVPLFVEMDGRFPNHHPDPTVEANLSHLKAAVAETRADLGIAYDGDADRVGAVDETGRVLWGDQLMILFSRSVLAEHAGAAIVGEVKCSMTLYQDIARHGGRPIMWKAGHSLIKAKMQEEGALLAGEMSGHIFFGHRWFGFDDGIYSSARLLELVSRTDRPVSSLLSDVPPTFSTPEIRVDCPEDQKFEVVRRAQAYFAGRYQAVTVDGVRVTFPDGWGLVRASNTQPLLVLRFEATTPERLAEIQALISGKVEERKREVGAG